MKKDSTTNSAQRAYMAAKSFLQALEEREAEIEKAYIAANGIRNANGTVPARIFCIDDKEVFDQANEDTAIEMEDCGLCADILDARKTLKAAEDNLIAYGLCLAPVSIRAMLERGAKENYRIRQELIDAVLRLDVSTVPGKGAAK